MISFFKTINFKEWWRKGFLALTDCFERIFFFQLVLLSSMIVQMCYCLNELLHLGRKFNDFFNKRLQSTLKFRDLRNFDISCCTFHFHKFLNFSQISSFSTCRFPLWRSQKRCRHLAPFSPKSILEPKTRFGGSKSQFCTNFALLSPKVHFWGHFAPRLKRLMKQTVSGAFLGTLGAKNRKWAHFSTFGSKSAKWLHFCILLPKSGKMTPFLIFGSKSAKKELRNRLFHKPFEPGSEMDPKKWFGAPKTHFWHFWGSKSHFGLQKRTFGPKIAFWRPFCALAQKAY